MAKRKTDSPWTTITVMPLVGTVDTRSETEDVVAGTWRWKEGFQLSGGTKLCVRPGHDRLFSSSTNGNLNPPAYTNYDFHDQGSPAGPVAPNYPTFLFQAKKNTGQHFLYAGTQERLGWLDESTGYWNIIATGKGGTAQTGLPATRFKADELNEQILFTNNVDAPFLTTVGSTTISSIASLNNIDAANDGLNLEKAAVVVEFNGFLLLMDLTMSGKRYSSRIAWCDYQVPTSWQWYQNNSLAGWQDLDYGEEILAAIPMAGAIYIFTTKAIWIGTISATNSNTNPNGVGNPVFAFQKVYSEPKAGAKCLAYPNMIANEGNGVWYGGSDGIYYYDPYTPEPVREEWLFRGTTAIYNDISSAIESGCCNQPIMEIYPDAKEFYVSWPAPADNPNGGCINSRTIIVNYQYKSIDYEAFGYSAFCNYVPAPASGSAAAVCPEDAVFVGASTQDLCLKSIGGVFALTQCSNVSVGQGTVSNGVYTPFTGSYKSVGIQHLLRMLLPTSNFDRDKSFRHLLAEVTPTTQAAPCILRCRIGYTFSETDPNLPDGQCAVVWQRLKDLPLVCQDTQTNVQYAKNNLRRNKGFEWNRLVRGRFLYLELEVANSDGSPAIGGAACFSRLEFDVRPETKP